MKRRTLVILIDTWRTLHASCFTGLGYGICKMNENSFSHYVDSLTIFLILIFSLDLCHNIICTLKKCLTFHIYIIEIFTAKFVLWGADSFVIVGISYLIISCFPIFLFISSFHSYLILIDSFLIFLLKKKHEAVYIHILAFSISIFFH